MAEETRLKGLSDLIKDSLYEDVGKSGIREKIFEYLKNKKGSDSIIRKLPEIFKDPKKLEVLWKTIKREKEEEMKIYFESIINKDMDPGMGVRSGSGKDMDPGMDPNYWFNILPDEEKKKFRRIPVSKGNLLNKGGRVKK